MNPRPTRILTGIDLPLAPSCGSTILTSDLYRQLADRFRVTFMALPPADPAWRHGFEDTVLCRTPKTPYGDGFPRYVNGLTAEVHEQLERWRPDVIHAHHLGFGLSLAFVRAAGSLPVVAVAHGTDVIEAERSKQARQALTEIVERSTLVVAPNTALAERIDQLTGHRFHQRLTLVPWGIPTAHARPAQPSFRGGRLRLLHAGRLDEHKGTVTAIEALALASDVHELTVIGSGSELDTLRQRARDLRVAGRVRFEPFAPRQQLWDAFAAFDALLFTTQTLEAFGLVAVEAQAHGLPVLYADLPGMGETLGSAGLAHPPGDPLALARTIDRLAGDTALQQTLSQRGIDNALRYDIARTAEHMAQATFHAMGMGATAHA